MAAYFLVMYALNFLQTCRGLTRDRGISSPHEKPYFSIFLLTATLKEIDRETYIDLASKFNALKQGEVK
jgi:hypothetical protein